MQDAVLYKADLTPTAQERVLTFPHRQIFMDEDNSTMFGLKEHPCKRIEFVEENSIEGDNHLAIEWSQNDDCNYLEWVSRGLSMPEKIFKALRGLPPFNSI